MPYKDKDKIIEYQKTYREKNKEKAAAYNLQYHKDNREELKNKKREYYKENRDRLLENANEYYKNNRDKIIERMRLYHLGYYEKNRAHLLEKNKNYVKTHKDELNQYLREKRKNRSEWLWELKCGLCCIICGEDDAACLDFHHVDPLTKDGAVSKLLANVSMDRVMEEIEKCDVLCANCHRKFHSKRKTSSTERNS